MQGALPRMSPYHTPRAPGAWGRWGRILGPQYLAPVSTRATSFPGSVSRDPGDRPARQDPASSPVSTPRGLTTPSLLAQRGHPPPQRELAQADTAPAPLRPCWTGLARRAPCSRLRKDRGRGLSPEQRPWIPLQTWGSISVNPSQASDALPGPNGIAIHSAK